ncbi:MAG: hypothetical protein EOP06_21055, partial [Proteobacteria bacterium]
MTSLRHLFSGRTWLPRFACSAAVVATLFGSLAGAAVPVFAQEGKLLTLDQALGYAGGVDQTGSIPRLRWLQSVPPGGSPTLIDSRFDGGKVALMKVDARTGATAPLYD